QVSVTYTVLGGGLRVKVAVDQLEPGAREVEILNEESAAFDDFAAPRGTLLGTAFGRWVDVTGPWARLRSGSQGVEFGVSALQDAQLRAGRELRGQLDWAGLDY